MAAKVWVGPATEPLVDTFIELSSTYYENLPVNDASVVRWRHLQAPGGPSTAVELRDGDECVGRMWIQVHPWSVRGQSVFAANPIDFLIREDHRTLPAFMTLFKASMREAAERADLVFHTTNPITDDLYRKLMKLVPVTELDGAVLPVRPFATAAASGAFNARSFGRIGDALFSAIVRSAGVLAGSGGLRLADVVSVSEKDALFERFRKEEAVCGARTGEHRRWRYLGAGAIQYRQRWIFRKGRVVGFVVTTDRSVNGLQGRFVVDLVWPGSKSRRSVAALWLQLAAEAARSRRDSLFFFYNRANDRLARLAGIPLVTVSRARLPQRVPVFVRPSPSSPHSFEGVDWASGYFVLSDFDLF